MSISGRNLLVVVPSFSIRKTEAGAYVLGKKFLSGMQAYVEMWQGEVAVFVEINPNAPSSMDDIEVHANAVGFHIEECQPGSRDFYSKLTGAAVVLGGPDFRLNKMCRRLAKMGIAAVPVTEYSLKTRCQIVGTQPVNKLVKMRRYVWELQQERAMKADFKYAAGIQCNGVPTFDAYKNLNKNTLLYFDTRTTNAMLETGHEAYRRTAYVLDRKNPLRLAYSGRLTAIKGSHHLLKIVHELKDRYHVPFTLNIFGTGDLEKQLRQNVYELGLCEEVKIHGAVDFATELVPYMRKNVDVFLSPHIQGDPSCTYLETMACGVPILGFDNEAWSGILDTSAVGWSARLGDTSDMAWRLRKLDDSRHEIAAKAVIASSFAAEHTFEKTYALRCAHLNSIAHAVRSRR